MLYRIVFTTVSSTQAFEVREDKLARYLEIELSDYNEAIKHAQMAVSNGVHCFLIPEIKTTVSIFAHD